MVKQIHRKKNEEKGKNKRLQKEEMQMSNTHEKKGSALIISK